MSKNVTRKLFISHMFGVVALKLNKAKQANQSQRTKHSLLQTLEVSLGFCIHYNILIWELYTDNYACLFYAHCMLTLKHINIYLK